MTKIKDKKAIRPAKIIKSSYRNLIITFISLAVVLVFLILYFALSQAAITITPAYSQQKVGFIVQIVDQKSLSNNKNLSQKMPGLLAETTVEASQEFPAQTIEVVQEKATGKLTVYNDYSQAQPLIATTRFESPQGLIFRLPQGVTIPAKSSLEVTVEADQSGAAYEIGAAKFILPALSEWRRQYVYAESFEPMARNTITKTQITQEFIEQTTDKLEAQLLNQAKEEINQGLSRNQTVLKKSLVSEIIKYSVNEEAGSLEDGFVISLTLGIKGLIVDEEELKQQAIDSLPDIYRQNQSLTRIDPDSFTYEIIYLDDNSESLLAQVKGDYNISVAAVDVDKTMLKGLTKRDAKIYLENLNDVAQASVRLPFWTKYLPTLEDHINITIKD